MVVGDERLDTIQRRRGAQLAGVISIVSRAAAEARGQAFDEEADAGLRAMIENQIEAESVPMFLSGRLYDDGVIDPRDTRTVVGMCLSAIASAPPLAASAWRALSAASRAASAIASVCSVARVPASTTVVKPPRSDSKAASLAAR